MRSATRSNRFTGVAARRRLNRSQSWRKKTPSAATTHRVKRIAESMRPALSPRLPAMQRALAALLLAVAATACGGETGPVARIHGTGGTSDVSLEIADQPDTRTRGLMYRQSLPEGHGMLFVFDE